MLPVYEAFREYDLPNKLSNELFDQNGKPLTRINKLSKVNIFVGPNNFGKSILIREILKTRSKHHHSKKDTLMTYLTHKISNALLIKH